MKGILGLAYLEFMALRHVWFVISILSKLDCSQSPFFPLIGDFAFRAAILVECHQIYTATIPDARPVSVHMIWNPDEKKKIGDCEQSTSKLNDRWYTLFALHAQAAWDCCINYSMFWYIFFHSTNNLQIVEINFSYPELVFAVLVSLGAIHGYFLRFCGLFDVVDA